MVTVRYLCARAWVLAGLATFLLLVGGPATAAAPGAAAGPAGTVAGLELAHPSHVQDGALLHPLRTDAGRAGRSGPDQHHGHDLGTPAAAAAAVLAAASGTPASGSAAAPSAHVRVGHGRAPPLFS